MKLLKIIKIAVVSAISLLAMVGTEAQTCSGPNVAIGNGQTCSSEISITSNPATVSISSGGTISTNTIGINNAGNITSLTNNGTISASTAVTSSGIGFGIQSNGTIGVLTNAGTISGTGDSAYTAGFGISQSSGTITTLNNSGTITGNNYGILYDGTITTLNNSNTIHGGADGVIGSGTITTLNNSGTINAGINAVYLYGGATIGTLINTNTGVITGFDGIFSSGTITTLNNSGTVGSGPSSAFGVWNDGGGYIETLNNREGANISGTSNNGIRNNGTINLLNNLGTISGGTDGINNGGTITTLNNSGTISGADYGINNSGTITTVNNLSSITGNTGGIKNGGDLSQFSTNTSSVTFNGQTFTVTQNGASSGAPWPAQAGTDSNTTIQWAGSSYIANLNNAQGGSNPLKYTGALPQSYGIILGSSSSVYGKLQASNITNWNTQTGTYSYYDPIPDQNYDYPALKIGTGTMNFGIYSGPVKANTYLAVLSGITATYLTPSTLTGNYTSGGNTYAYQLVLESGSDNIWDLLFPSYVPGPTTADTQQSLANTAQVLHGTITILNTALTNSFTYDCGEFGANNICISAGGRNTAVSAANGLNNTSALLIGAYRVSPNLRIGAYADQNLSVNNAGSTVNLGNNTPLLGLFGVWNERLDGTGTEVKVSAAYGQKGSTITRSVVGTSEAGSGGSQINSQGAQATVKYGFGVANNVIVSPYVGIRYTQNNMSGYTEASSSTVTAPLTYSALNTNATTVLAGVGASYRFIPQAIVFASAGVESDTNTNNGSLSATGVNGLTPVSLNSNPVKTRPTAMLGASYDVAKNQRLGVTGIYRQEPYQAMATTTVMATYTVGL